MMLFGLILGMLTTMIVYSAYILVISFTLWMAVDAAKQDRYWWVVLIVGVPIIGSAVYFFTEKKHVYAKAISHHIHLSQTESEHEVAHKKHVSHKKQEVKTEGEEKAGMEEAGKKEETAPSGEGTKEEKTA